MYTYKVKKKRFALNIINNFENAIWLIKIIRQYSWNININLFSYKVWA